MASLSLHFKNINLASGLKLISNKDYIQRKHFERHTGGKMSYSVSNSQREILALTSFETLYGWNVCVVGEQTLGIPLQVSAVELEAICGYSG